MILAIRLLTGQLLSVIQQYPSLIDGAYVIIAWIGIKLLAEYSHAMEWIEVAIPRAVSLVVVVILFAASYLYARTRPQSDVADAEPALESEELLRRGFGEGEGDQFYSRIWPP